MWDNPDKFERVRRPRKHRYIMFLGSKTQKKNMLSNLKYEIKPYPKVKTKDMMQVIIQQYKRSCFKHQN